MPKNFILKAPEPGYTCGPATVVEPSTFVSADKRRVTQASSVSRFNQASSLYRLSPQGDQRACSLAVRLVPRKHCSWSSFYNDSIATCSKCSCGCRSSMVQTGSCIEANSHYLSPVVSNSGENFEPLVQCASHMCPIRIHWHNKLNYKEYWRVKITITNFNYRMNYSDWNLVIQHPNFSNLTKIFSFNYKSLVPYAAINDTAMLWGVKFYNNLLTQAGPVGNVQTEVIFGKNKETFTFDEGWGFPRRVYFNGDNCVMPPPDA